MRLWSWVTGLFRMRGVLEQPLNSFVLLVSKPHRLNGPTLEGLASRALGIPFGRHGTDDAAFVMDNGDGQFIVLFRDRGFAINGAPSLYFDRPDDVVAAIQEPRACAAVREHRAWVSVDLLGDAEGEALDDAYRVMGKLAAALAGSDCLAVYAPATGQLRVYDASLGVTLRAANPLREFTRPALVPAFPSDPKDPRVQAATAEARRRWPEFRAAFEARHRDQSFAVRAPINDGEGVEPMWVDVTEVADEAVSGTLGNEPAQLKHVRAGDHVSVPLADLTDWIYTDGLAVHGGFTVEAVYSERGRE